MTAPSQPDHDQLASAVAKREQRRLRAQRTGRHNVWFGLGMFGLVGWSVAVPTLIGVSVGTWIDHHWPSRISWTLTLLILGVAVGFFNAWGWMQRETDSEDT